MLKPPLVLSTCPVIQPECGEANSATIGAMSPGRPRRRSDALLAEHQEREQAS